MSHGIRTLRCVLVLGLAIAMTGCRKKEEPNDVQDMNSVRAELKARVEGGKLTKEEAIVRLAEARVKYGSKKKGEGSKLSPELEVFGKELKGKVAKGEMTDEEAMAAWEEAIGKGKASAKASSDSGKEKE